MTPRNLLALSSSALLIVLVASLPVSIHLPVAQAKMQLKAGDTWTLSGKSTYTASGWGAEAGKFYEADHFTDTYKVDSLDGAKLRISEVFVDTWTDIATGWFLNDGTSNSGTNTHNFWQVINSTTLVVTAETWTKYDVGHQTWTLIDPSALVQGGKVVRTWWVPVQGNTTNAPNDLLWKVSGSQTIPVNGMNLQIWNVTYTSTQLGSWYYHDTDTNTYPYSAGTETDVLQYDANYGILVGYSVSGTYAAVGHCSTCMGGWTETTAFMEQITSSNFNLGP